MGLRHCLDAPAPPARVVVIGAGGFIGGAILRRLEAAGAPALGVTRADLDLLSPGAGAKLAALLRSEDALVAAAAKAPVKDVAMLADNMRLLAALVEALTLRSVAHVLNIGSDAVYADSPAPLTETSPRAPDSLHGVMHLAREIALRGAAAAMPGGTPFATLRPTLVYGVGDPHHGYGPNRFRRQAAAGRPIELFGEGEEMRDHVAVADVAELAARMLFRRSQGALNAVSGRVISFRAIAERIAAATPAPIVGRPRAGPMPHDGWRAFDITAMRAAFPDFEPTPIETGLAAMIR